MTRRIDESDLFGDTFLHLLFGEFGLVSWFSPIGLNIKRRVQPSILDCKGTDSLRDCAILLSTFVVVSSEEVQQRSFSMVYMSHDCDNR